MYTPLSRIWSDCCAGGSCLMANSESSLAPLRETTASPGWMRVTRSATPTTPPSVRKYWASCSHLRSLASYWHQIAFSSSDSWSVVLVTTCSYHEPNCARVKSTL
ncbi:hypothetical protein ACKVV1_011528 [Pyricularia oryzae]